MVSGGTFTVLPDTVLFLCLCVHISVRLRMRSPETCLCSYGDWGRLPNKHFAPGMTGALLAADRFACILLASLLLLYII